MVWALGIRQKVVVTNTGQNAIDVPSMIQGESGT